MGEQNTLEPNGAPVASQLRQAVIASLKPTEVEAFVAFSDKCVDSGLIHPGKSPGDSRDGFDDEVTSLRFLRARKYDVEGAYAQFTEARQLHQANDIVNEYDNIDIAEFEEARNMYPHWLGRTDKRGQPICFFDIACLNPNRLADFAASTSSDSKKARPALIRAFACFDLMTRFVLPMCMVRPISETVPPVSACLYVADISTLGFKQVWNLRKYVQDISKLLSTSYPEVIDRILIIGAPSWFPKVWSWVKGWVDPVTGDKIHFIPAGAELTQLGELIEVENIPKQYGGKFEGWHGTLPELDDEFCHRLDWVEGVEKRIPIGPLKWVVDDDGELILMAVGTENGQERRTKLARMTE
ncbi:CRAL/TRIO domain-containing protein [Lophiostoma macrostomum CBS 122681]|uniref:CRAL/TRIO domain-containing protein n=1 Tax=Lophiostoma macrostomum CBS 122681 TaxID=1314788 RepID=A0A6A6TTC8_9PLEO|nr:CRAL/TRIO domain-containing protein [Lophiostoma macrostomum CBS 122681]